MCAFSRRMALLRTLTLVVLLLVPAPRAPAGLADACVGDCDGDGMVAINELIAGVGIALGQQPVSTCANIDRNGDGAVTVEELIAAVRAALDGCPGSPTATPTDAPTAMPTATAAVTLTLTASATPTLPVTEVPSATAPATPTATAPPTLSATPSFTPTATATPFGAPTDLVVAIDGGDVRLVWNNPDPLGGFTQARVLRRLNAAVDGPDDAAAETVFSGAASNAAHPLLALLPNVPEDNRTYHYAVFACSAAGSCGADGAAATLTPTLPDVLRGGGYVIHWRHASADVCSDKTNLGTAANPIVPDWWKSCDANCPAPPGESTATARQLNDEGRDESVRIGQAFDILRLPVGRVLSSEFCRNVGTAELMDLGAPIEQLPSITFFVYDEANRCANSYELIAAAPAAGTNTAIIGHAGFPSPACPVIGTLAWGEAAIFKPDGAGGTPFVTRVSDDEWADLLPAGPSGLSAGIEATHVRLTWSNGPAYPRVRVLRRLNDAVAGPADPDATLVFSGVTDTLLDPVSNLLPGTPSEPRTYHYAVYGCVGSSCETVGTATFISPTLAQLLRAGGYTIFFRHASARLCADNTDLGTAANTTVPNWWKSCDATCPLPPDVTTATARQLSDVGRIEATSIGAAFAAQGFPVGRVISSEFCRAVQTAELADFGAPIEQSPAVTFFVYDEAGRCEATRVLLAERPTAGSNTAIISHSGNDCPPISGLSMGGAAIYRPNPGGGATFVTALNWEQWGTLP